MECSGSTVHWPPEKDWPSSRMSFNLEISSQPAMTSFPEIDSLQTSHRLSSFNTRLSTGMMLCRCRGSHGGNSFRYAKCINRQPIWSYQVGTPRWRPELQSPARWTAN